MIYGELVFVQARVANNLVLKGNENIEWRLVSQFEHHEDQRTIELEISWPSSVDAMVNGLLWKMTKVNMIVIWCKTFGNISEKEICVRLQSFGVQLDKVV